MSVSFRKATAQDDETILELMREFYAFENLSFDETAARWALNLVLANENFGQVWIIEQSEKIAGYVVLTFGFSLEFHGRDAFIDEIYLRSGFRGAGIGKAALEFLQNSACKQACGLCIWKLKERTKMLRRFIGKAVLSSTTAF